MKKMNILKGLLIMTGFIIVFTMCENEDDNKSPYVGEWTTANFQSPIPGDTSGGTITQKMTFAFSENEFTTEILNMISEGVYKEFLGIQGEMTEESGQTLEISLQSIGTWDPESNGYNWKSRSTHESEFNNLYNAYLMNSMPKDFDAVYETRSGELDLIIAAANDTIHLSKQ